MKNNIPEEYLPQLERIKIIKKINPRERLTAYKKEYFYEEEAPELGEDVNVLYGLYLVENVFYSLAYCQALNVLLSLGENSEEARQLKFQDDGQIVVAPFEPLGGLYTDENAVNEYKPENIFADPFNPNITVKEQAVICYFLTNPSEDPLSRAVLHKAVIEEIKNTFIELDKYYYEASDHNSKTIDIEKEFICFLGKLFARKKNDFLGALGNIEILEKVVPDKISALNDPISNALLNNSYINTGAKDLHVFGEDNSTTVYLLADYDENQSGIKLTNCNLTQQQWDISNAVASIWKQSQKENKPAAFTIDMVYENMPGGSDRPSEKEKKEISEAIEFFRIFDLEIDATDEFKKRGIIKEDDSFYIKEHYLSIKEGTYKIKNGGQIVKAYILKTEPPILSYAEATNQILSIPRKYLTISKVKDGRPTRELIPMTGKRQAITSYLLKRIAVMKHANKDHTLNKKITDKIALESIFESAEIKNPGKQNAARYRNFIFEVLDYEKAVGNIKDYEKINNGRSLKNIRILF